MASNAPGGVQEVPHFHSKKSIIRAQELRSRATDCERILWSKLRELKIMGYRFRRQSPFRNYTLDFVEHGAKLVVELDGGQHGLPEQVRKDTVRDRILEAEGYAVLRISNLEIRENLYGAFEAITRELQKRHPHPPIDVNADWRPPHKGEVKKGKPLPRKGLRRLA
jgi:very-short-patch-repair endonuclease